MTDSQEKTKLGYDSFNSFFQKLEPNDYHSKMVLEILFKALLERKNAKNLPLPSQEE
jgi:hypothetical protein